MFSDIFIDQIYLTTELPLTNEILHDKDFQHMLSSLIEFLNRNFDDHQHIGIYFKSNKYLIIEVDFRYEHSADTFHYIRSDYIFEKHNFHVVKHVSCGKMVNVEAYENQDVLLDDYIACLCVCMSHRHPCLYQYQKDGIKHEYTLDHHVSKNLQSSMNVIRWNECIDKIATLLYEHTDKIAEQDYIDMMNVLKETRV